MVFSPILLTSYGSHSDHFSFQKSVPVCHAYSHVSVLSHFCLAIQGGIKVKYIRLKNKVMVARKMDRIEFNGHETTEVSIGHQGTRNR